MSTLFVCYFQGFGNRILLVWQDTHFYARGRTHHPQAPENTQSTGEAFRAAQTTPSSTLLLVQSPHTHTGWAMIRVGYPHTKRGHHTHTPPTWQLCRLNALGSAPLSQLPPPTPTHPRKPPFVQNNEGNTPSSLI